MVPFDGTHMRRFSISLPLQQAVLKSHVFERATAEGEYVSWNSVSVSEKHR